MIKSETSPIAGSRDQPTRVTISVLGLASLTIMANATIAPSLPGLTAAFRDTPNIETIAGLALSLPSLSIVLTAALFGWLADKTNRLFLLTGLVSLYGLAGSSGAFASSIETLLAGRIALGIGVAGIMTLVTMMAGEFWQGPPRERFMGWQAAATSGGGVVFLIVGGLLAEQDWRLPFLIYLLALPLIPAVLLFLRKPLAACGEHTRGQTAGPIDWKPILEIGSIAFCAMVAFYLIPTRLPFLIEELGLGGPTISGLAIGSMTAAGVPASLGFSRLRRQLDAASVFALALGAMAAGLMLIGTAGTLWPIFAGCLLTGVGIGLVMPNQVSWLMARIGDNQRGRAAGLLTMAVFGGQFVSPLAAGILLGFADLSAVFRVFAVALTAMAVIVYLSRARPAVSPAQ